MDRVKIKLSGGRMPEAKSPLAAAYDLYVPCDVELRDGRQVVDLKFSMELAHRVCAVIQPRSGYSAKGIEAVAENGNVVRVDADVILGLIDEDYRGSCGVILIARLPRNCGRLVLKEGTRIAQMRFVEVPELELCQVDELDMSADRGGGFGHTGSF